MPFGSRPTPRKETDAMRELPPLGEEYAIAPSLEGREDFLATYRQGSRRRGGGPTREDLEEVAAVYKMAMSATKGAQETEANSGQRVTAIHLDGGAT